MADISCDTCTTSVNHLFSAPAADQRTRTEFDIIEGQLADTRVELHQQGQRLTDTTSGTENGNLGGLCHMMVSSIEFDELMEIERTCLAVAEKARRWTWPNICRAKKDMLARDE